MTYKLTIGLEVHAELNTKTKMFCDSPNPSTSLGASHPNTLICPICMGYPGTLPVINKEAVKSILRLGTALGGELADYTEFDRKNYFYPDIPKGYQISQYKKPLVSGGELAGVKLTRVHLEEDTARSSHNENSKLKIENSLLDFNRAGVPLMELVTEPVMHTAEEALRFAKELQLLLQYIGISGANMEKGEMRVEANISVSKTDEFGTKVEVKNINSFRAVGKTIEFEYKRQTELLDKGERVVQETRGWDENTGETFSQRLKESAHDYRYFPCPDLPKLFLSEIPELSKEELKKTLPELPWQKRERFLGLGISEEHVEIYVSQREWGKFFDEVSNILTDRELIKLASNYITSELKTVVSPGEFVEVINMISRGELSSKGAKGVLKVLMENGGEAKAIAAENNLMQESDREVLKPIVEEILKDNSQAPIEFLIGQAMKKSGGRANPTVLRELFEGA